MSAEPFEFDLHGDLKLEVGAKHNPEPVIFIVCSRTLARVSQVFDRMLYGDFAEAKPESGDWVVKLPEEKAVPLAIFFHIAHGHFHRVPKVLSIDDLYDLTVLTNYYDSTRLLGPWAESWIASIDENARGTTMSMAKTLWVCWEFGRKESFSRIARRMLMESDGSLSADDPVLKELQLPPEIIESIANIRLLTIQALLDVFRDLVENLIVVDEKPRWCRYATWMGPHRCESMILGSMTFCLARAGLWPLLAPDEVNDSIIGLYRTLTNLVIHDIGQGTEGPGIDHRECNPSNYLLGEVERIMGEIANPVTDFHKENLEEQARKFSS